MVEILENSPKIPELMIIPNGLPMGNVLSSRPKGIEAMTFT